MQPDDSIQQQSQLNLDTGISKQSPGMPVLSA